jgi:hypothetical protein
MTTLALWAMLTAVLAAPATNLSDLARREAVRRLLTPAPSVVLTNDTLPAPRAGDFVATVEAGDSSVPLSSGPDPFVTSSPPPEAPADPPHDAAWWRQQQETLRSAIRDGEAAVADLQSRVNALTTDVAGRDDPAAREVVRAELATTVQRLARARTKLDADRRALETFGRDARRAGVPPGWLR